MLQDILEDRAPDQKPRFFLHDEMVAWLTDNLQVSTTIHPNKSVNHNLTQRFNLYDQLTVGLHIQTKITLGSTQIIDMGSSVSLIENERAFQCLANVNETCMQKITQMEHQMHQLQRRIELLENPLPI